MKKRGAEIINIGNAMSRFVVMKSVEDMSVVARGNDLGKVLKRANRAGVALPVVLFPHDPQKRYIY
ncbi:MAG: hypothetical protein HYV35_01805 [Lentisphaerae bacterium]|nr:hypothetical protein [Lentisphaerota bacterium]